MQNALRLKKGNFQSRMSEEPMQCKPQIFRQGLVLVLIPLLVGSCVLLLMSQVWIGTERLVVAEEQQSEFLAHFNFALHRWADAVGNLMARSFSQDEGYAKLPEIYAARMSEEFDWLRRLKADKTQLKGGSEDLEKLEGLCLNSLKQLSLLPRDVTSDPIANFKTLQQLPLIFHQLYVLPGKLGAPLENEWKILQRMRQKEEIQSNRAKVIALLCVLGNIVLSVALVWAFARTFTQRLLTVTNNASLLPKVQVLPVHLDGNDELSYLDSSLHAASAKLVAAAEHRRTILGMVAHDMRSPLLAAQLCLEVLEELMDGKFNSRSNEDLSLALGRLKAILEQVHLLLTVEKAADSMGANSTTNLHSDSSPDVFVSEDLQKDTSEKADIEPLEHETTLPHQPQSENLAANQLTALAESVKLQEQLGSTNFSPVQRLATSLQNLFIHPKIFHKGLYLVMIPLIVQSVFLLLLSRQILTTENILAQERFQCNIVMNADRVFINGLKASVAEGTYNVTGDPVLRAAVLRSFKTVISEFKEAMPMARKVPEWRSIMDDLHELMTEHLKKMDEQMKGPIGTSMKDIVARFRANRPMQQAVAEISQRANLQFKKEEFRLNELREEQKAARHKVAEVLVWGIIANFLLAFGMLLSFSNDIKRRVSLLVDDASRLGESKPLNKLIGGSDELAYLDLIFHHTQSQLVLAAEERSNMMNTLAAQMAGPLKDAKLSLASFRQKEDAELNSRKLKQLSRAEENINRVLDLLNDLLTMETLETGKISLESSKCNARELVEDSIATVASLSSKKKISIKNECQDFNFVADKSRLIQTLVNFISNAIKFSPENSTITVISSEQNGFFKISVNDEGPGMDEETSKRVFEKFFQAAGPQKNQGFGLGLAICRMIIDSHHGRIGVDSKPAQGSSFWFELPLSEIK